MNLNAKEILALLGLIIVPSVAIGAAILFVVKKFLEKDEKMKLLEIRKAELKDTRMLRLQAYERLILFLERINPSSLIARNFHSDMLSQELQLLLVQTINAEYEHNLSQQMYVSNDSWKIITDAKNEIIKTIAAIAQQVPSEATAGTLSRVLLETIAAVPQELPNQTAINFLKEEVRNIL